MSKKIVDLLSKNKFFDVGVLLANSKKPSCWYCFDQLTPTDVALGSLHLTNRTIAEGGNMNDAVDAIYHAIGSDSFVCCDCRATEIREENYLRQLNQLEV